MYESRVAFRETILVSELCYVGAVTRAIGPICLAKGSILEKYDNKIVEVCACGAGTGCLGW
jgi:hypothetical protein